MGTALGVIAIWYTFGRMVRMSKVGLHGGLASWALLFALQALLLFVTILAHECGHLLAGWFVGFRVQEIRIGPLQIRRAECGLAITVNRCLPWFDGGAICVAGSSADAADLRHLRRRAAIVAAGGPLASVFLAAWAAVLLIGFTHRHARPVTTIDFWMIFSLSLILIWSVAAFVGNLIPVQVRGRLSDGAVMLALLRGGPCAEQFCARIILSAASAAGKHPRLAVIGEVTAPLQAGRAVRAAPEHATRGVIAADSSCSTGVPPSSGSYSTKPLGEVAPALQMMRAGRILKAP